MAPRKTARQRGETKAVAEEREIKERHKDEAEQREEVAAQTDAEKGRPLVEVLDDRVLTDNVAVGGVTYARGTKLGDLPAGVRKNVLHNEALYVDGDQ